jgi:hypothetical protein
VKRYYFLLPAAVWLVLAASLSRADNVFLPDFSGKKGAGSYTLVNEGAGKPPQLVSGNLRLLDAEANQRNAVLMDRTASGLYRHIDVRWDMAIGTGGETAAFVLLNTATAGVKGPPPTPVPWGDPRLKNTFALLFNIHSPPTNDPFNKDGNIYDRPQREIALYWNGVEVVRRLSPVEFRTSRPLTMQMNLDFVCGGAELTLNVAGTEVYSHTFLPGMQPYESRPAFGGTTSAATTTLELSKIAVTYRDRFGAPPPPRTLTAIDGLPLDSSHATQSGTVAFPDKTDSYGRILCTLTLDKPDSGPIDPWDRAAAIYVYDDTGQKFEILRFITPYKRGYTWQVDVSDYRPLLRGKKKVEAWCVTYANGWKISVRFDFYPGKTDRKAVRVVNLWTGSPEIGNPEKPISAFFGPKNITIDPKTSYAKLRFTVTGHGMSPNTENAAEFMPSKRTVTVGGRVFENVLWKDDNYLNPCRPQGGTWKYDRAGWAPGDVVHPWDLDITGLIPAGQSGVLHYDVAPYTNKDRGKTNAPTHWVESQLILYKK